MNMTMVCGVALAAAAMCGVVADEPETLRLWSGDAPGALGKADKDVPTLTVYLPAKESASGAAVVICPGGGYGGLAGHEGKDYAFCLNKLGVAGFVLKYRLGSGGYRHPVMLQDVSRAIRLVRSRAADWAVDPKRVGVMGSSAGGHLASTVVTHFDDGQPQAEDPVERQSSRPDLGILCYPVITMGRHTHQGSKNNLLGPDPSAALVEELSNELRVTSRTPPCFVWHTYADQAVDLENSLDFAGALRKAGVPFDLHVYENGPHGIGLRDQPPFDNVHPWARDLAFWLKERGFCK